MKYLLLLGSLISYSIAFAQENPKETQPIIPILFFSQTEMNLGEAMEGEKLEYTFKFVNKGKETLIISNILTSCGCTIVNWSRQPVYPGKKGEIKAVLDTKNKNGLQDKSIIILSNSQNPKEVLKIQVNVIPRTEAIVNVN